MAGDRWLTFDCYGTIADWKTCMRAALASVAGNGPAESQAALLLAAYHQVELTLEAGPYLPYRDILASGLRTAARRLGIKLGHHHPGHQDLAGPDADDPSMVFVRAWPDMPLFGDATPALRALADDGWKLAILTNCDDDLFALTEPKLPVAFDAVVTAERVRSYKPDLGHFREFARLTGATPANWIHVANSWVHDILPATRMGLRSIWVDRDLTGHPAKLADRRITAMRRLPDTVADVNALPA